MHKIWIHVRSLLISLIVITIHQLLKSLKIKKIALKLEVAHFQLPEEGGFFPKNIPLISLGGCTSKDVWTAHVGLDYENNPTKKDTSWVGKEGGLG